MMRSRNWTREVSLCGDAFFSARSQKTRPISESVSKESFRHFEADPFDPRLRTHKIHGLSARLGRTVYSVWIEADLRALFYLAKDTVVSIAIGDHRIYRE